jgi:dipeptidyl-peptidase 4
MRIRRMRIRGRTLLAGCLLNGLAMSASGAADVPDQTELAARYVRAEAFLPDNSSHMVRNADVVPHWIGTLDAFWYARQNEAGTDFKVVDATNGHRRGAFDLDEFARALSAGAGEPVDAHHLRVSELKFDSTLRVSGAIASVKGRQFKCQFPAGSCVPVTNPRAMISPDGKWIAFLKDQDLWLRSTEDGSEHALSNDGEPHFGYGTAPGTGGVAGMRAEGQRTPMAMWSPDSKRLVTEHLDERMVSDLHLIEYAPSNGVRPRLHSIRYAFPGDLHKPTAALVIFDVDSGKSVSVAHAPFDVTYVGPIADDRIWWSRDARTLYTVPREEDQRRAQLIAIDAKTGSTRVVLEETGKSYVDIGGSGFDRCISVLADKRILWYSERDNFGHFYLYDRSGKLIRQLTSGNWKVTQIARIDEKRQRVYFVAVGRESGEDPYQRHLYAINLDGTGLVDLTPENGDHDIRIEAAAVLRLYYSSAAGPLSTSISPSGKYLVDTYSRPDAPPESTLRTTTGKLISRLEMADSSALIKSGLRLPEPFSVLAADGTTKLYGTIFRPIAIDVSKKYPVVDVIYPGPQETVTQKTFMGALFGEDENMQGLAELGFIVVNVDGRGTPMRSKEFHDVSYRDWAQAGNLEDHMATLRQLAMRYPYMDLARVAITGSSGGGYAAARAILVYPDFFKVAISVSGNHDLSGYLRLWGMTYQGPFDAADYDRSNNVKLAANLRGQLFLAHGDIDDNVPPSQTMQLVDALIKAGKSFEFLLVPGMDHALAGVSGSPYLQRRKWDFLVKNLLGAEPPPFAIPQNPN